MIRIFAAVCMFLTAAAIAQSPRIKIGYLPVVNQTELVADELGLYKKQRLDVELVRFQTGPAALQGLLSGDLQAVESAAVPSLNLASQNLPLYYLFTGGINTPRTPAGTIMIRADDQSIKSFRDLKSRKIGQLGKGTITHLWLWNAAQRFGLKRDDFQEIFVAFPQMGGLLSSKQVDAVYAWPPFDTIISQAGQGRVLMTDTEWNPYSVVNVFTVRREWADKNEDVVRRLMRVAIEANRWINDHPNEFREILGKKMNLPSKVYRNMRMFHYPRNGYQLMPSIWDFYFLMIKAEQLKPFADPAAVMDSYWINPAIRFIAPVLKEIGVQKDPVVEEVLKLKLPNLPEPVEKYLAPWER